MPVERRGRAIRVTVGVVNWQQEEPRGRDGKRQLSRDGTSRVTGDSHARICERLGVKFPGPTRRCPRIAQQIALAFGIPINKDVVRRILAVRYQPAPDSAGPSWLTVLGHAKDSLWSLDLFRCESAVLRTHWILVVMDHCTRRIVGFGVHHGVVDGLGLRVGEAGRSRRVPLSLSAVSGFVRV